MQILPLKGKMNLSEMAHVNPLDLNRLRMYDGR